MSDSSSLGNRPKKRVVGSKSVCIPRVLVLIETTHSFSHGNRLIEGISHYASENGPWSIQFELRSWQSLPPDWLREWQGDGIISRTVDLNMGLALKAIDKPRVELYGDPRCGIAQVQCDDAALGRMAVDHFMERGLRHFGYFIFGEVWWSASHRRAFVELLKSRGWNCHVYQPPIMPEQAIPAWKEEHRPFVLKWLRSLPLPIGIFTTNQTHSARLLALCQELGLAVPDEVAILSSTFDPVISETVRPTLSGIDNDTPRVGYEAARLLDCLMAGEEPPTEPIYVPPRRVVVRQSTDLMCIEDSDVVQAMQFIRDFACKGINVARVAESVGLSISALQRRFRRHLNRTVKDEILRIQIECAKSLLDKTDKIGESIARKCGFSSHQYFSKAFHREVGMTPQAFHRLGRFSTEVK